MSSERVEASQGQARETVLRGLGLWSEALTAASDEEAIATARADLEVLSPADLLRVATLLAGWAPRRWVAPTQQGKLLQRLEHIRFEVTWNVP